MNVKFTNYDLAGLIWDTMYPDRRKFHELETSTKAEWITLVQICRNFITIENEADQKVLEFLKNKIKI